ncbi:MAG: ester cyclase [Gaiellaceae bacterium]
MIEHNKAQMRRFYEDVVNGWNVDLIDDLIAPDFVEHEQFPGLSGEGREGVKEFFALLRRAFPDLHMEPEQLIAEGDTVVARVRMTGTQQGEFMGMPATGKQVDVQTIDIIRFRNGMATEHWGVTDSVALMQQLGAMPAPAGAPA